MTDVDNSSARRRKLIGGTVVAAFAVVLIAIVVVRSAGEKVLNENGDTLVLVGKETKESDEVGLDAVLTDVGGCLGVSGDGTTAGSQVVIWPHGTTIDTPEPLRIKIDGKTYGIGDRISTGGGSSSIEPSSYFYDKVPEACRTAKVFVADNG